jgi:hypothetical protein
MTKEMTVETYLKWIRRNLHGIERDNIDNIVEELQGHINEKAQDRAEEKGLKKPDDAVYQQVLEELGPPEVVAIDYLKILPKRPSKVLKAFLGLQLGIGVVALLLGINEFLLAQDLYNSLGKMDNYVLVMDLVGSIFLFMGLGTMVLSALQLKRPGLIVHYHSGSVLLTITLSAGILFVLLGYLVWRFFDKDMNYEQITAVAMPIFLGITFACIFGLRASEEFQRRLSLEELDNKLFEKKRSSSRNAMIAIVVVSMFLVSSAGVALISYDEPANNKKSELVSVDHIGGKYDASIEHWKTYNPQLGYDVGDDMVTYTVNGTKHTGSLNVELMDALAWMKNNTEANSTILSWWDYGHSIRGLGERNCVIANPSKNMKDSIVNPSSIKEWDDQVTVSKVGKAFAADNVSTTISIMKDTGAKYLLTNSRDAKDISYVFFTAAGIDPDDYFKYEAQKNPYIEPPSPEPTALGRQTTLYKIWLGSDLPGLTLVYSDLNTRIYKLE